MHKKRILVGSKYTAENIPNAKLVAYETGGHMLIGHGEDAKAAVRNFLQERQVVEIVN